LSCLHQHDQAVPHALGCMPSSVLGYGVGVRRLEECRYVWPGIAVQGGELSPRPPTSDPLGAKRPKPAFSTALRTASVTNFVLLLTMSGDWPPLMRSIATSVTPESERTFSSTLAMPYSHFSPATA